MLIYQQNLLLKWYNRKQHCVYDTTMTKNWKSICLVKKLNTVWLDNITFFTSHVVKPLRKPCHREYTHTHKTLNQYPQSLSYVPTIDWQVTLNVRSGKTQASITLFIKWTLSVFQTASVYEYIEFVHSYCATNREFGL